MKMLPGLHPYEKTMIKDDFYQERILWRANKNKLLEKRCILYSEAEEPQKQCIANKLKMDIKPVLLFWDSSTQWTVLGSKEICSYHNGNLMLYI